ncbi:SAM-dependent methyltransferase [Tomitella fengzijianii]|uniref:Class I SAM-dependent methyltransferase n=1 Tax=Tomitella fengzijianii TaxID=2597660 RepID=A0A516X632_9ACTN|nr:cyclopropane-fatty-acyl-phospholipid synthase family protein [Tomitella fengzijianii]QDQ98519.1 class I SAM-dependent methyltransferase [Tomitella fengzijianii]
MGSVAASILATFEDVLKAPLPLRLQAWDGSEAGPPEAPVRVVFRNRRALRRILYAPEELGLARAYVSGDLEVQGSVFDLLDMPQIIERVSSHGVRGVDARSIRRGVARMIRHGVVGPPPRPPATELRRRAGGRHSEVRDAVTVSSHYDIGNEFYRLLLGPTMVYSCGYWEDGCTSLDDAQWAKCEHISRKLGLKPGMRLLDVGCGWGTMVMHAAREHGVRAVGVTLSHAQVELGRRRVAEAGLEDLVEIRLQDYREVHDGPFDAICSIGMAEHVGLDHLPVYAEDLYGLLHDGGRLLNHQISSVRPLPPGHSSRARAQGGARVMSSRRAAARTFIDRYVFPDGEILPLSATVDALEQGGFEVRDAESLREHYALTLRAWVANLTGQWDRAVALVGVERARIWLLYLAASAIGFEYPHRLGLNQTLAVRPGPGGESGMPHTRAWLYG